AMEQRITRAKQRIAKAVIAYGTPGAAERAERLGAVAAMVYLIFNEGYSATGGDAHIRLPLCQGAGAPRRRRQHRPPRRPGPQLVEPRADRRRPRAPRQGAPPPPAGPLPG